jgi:hypothetical protein
LCALELICARTQSAKAKRTTLRDLRVAEQAHSSSEGDSAELAGKVEKLVRFEIDVELPLHSVATQ